MSIYKTLFSLSVLTCLSTSLVNANSTPPTTPPPPAPVETREEKGACGVFITADFLYWTTHETNVDFTRIPSLDSNNTIHQPDWKFTPGFRVGLGKEIPHGGWDIYANYTWFQSDNNKAHRNVNRQYTIPFSVVLPANTVILSQTASLKWDLDSFNVLDLELGRRFNPVKYLSVRPHWGFKGTLQEQKRHSSYDAVVLENGGSFNGQTVEFVTKDKLHYWGLGMRGGLDLFWQFTKCFGLYGDFAISGLWEYFKSKSNMTLTSLSTGASAFAGNRLYLHAVKVVYEWATGLRWERKWSNDRYRFLLEAGWEVQSWSGQNQFLNLTRPEGGDLNLQGLTVHALFEF